MKRLLIVLLALSLSPGCTRKIETEESGPEKNGDAKVEETPKRKPLTKRKGMAGKWLLEYSHDFPDGKLGYMPVGVLDVTRVENPDPGGPEFEAKLLDEHPERQFPRSFSNISDEHSRVVVRREDKAYDFRVQFIDGEIRGTMIEQNGGMRPARFYPLGDAVEQIPYDFHEHQDELAAALQKRQNLEGYKPLVEFINKHPKSPLAFKAVMAANPALAFNPSQPPNPKREELLAHIKLIDKVCLHWGEFAHASCRSDFARRLFHTRTEPAVALRALGAGEKDDDEAPIKKEFQQISAAYVEPLETEVELADLERAETNEERKAAAETLTKRIENGHPFHPYALYLLGEAAQKSGDDEAALHRYAQLAALPGVADALNRDLKHRDKSTVEPRKTVEELWRKKHGSLDGLDGHLDSVMDSAIDRLARGATSKPIPPRRSRRTVLVELMTGTECNRCVASEAVLDALGRRFADATVRVLQYQLAAPELGPLVNNDSKSRSFNYQGAHSPPVLYVNGFPVYRLHMTGQPVSIPTIGSMATYPFVYWANTIGRDSPMMSPVSIMEAALSNIEIVDRVPPPPPFEIELKGRRDGDVLHLSAEVEGPADVAEKLWFRLVLAEDHVEYKGANGVKRHPMVARHMPLKAGGEPLKDGKFQYTGKVNIAELKQQLLDELAAMEARKNQAKLKETPMELKNLHLIGFVQNDQNQILATESIVVCGEGTYNLPPNFPGPVEAPRPKAAEPNSSPKESP